MAHITIQCHCEKVKIDLDIPQEAIPLSSAFCHCSACRHATGQLAASFAVIPNQLDLDIPYYATSEHRKRYFCPTCGANIADLQDGTWRVCTGTFDTQGLLKRDQIFVDGDGGMSVWFDSNASPKKSTHLDAKCHCGKIEFSIAPGNYSAGIDFCRSCRLTTGFEYTTWVSVPKEKVDLPKAKEYESSPGCRRGFCPTCGAAVYVLNKPDIVDIAAGLLRSEGQRAEPFLKWKDIGYPEEACDQELLEGFISRFEKWKEEH